jgi:hypothetical protein
MTHKELERLARDAHVHGIDWSEYWERHAEQVRKAEPWNRRRFKRLYDRLLSLVTSGDTDGQQAVGDDNTMPWEVIANNISREITCD